MMQAVTDDLTPTQQKASQLLGMPLYDWVYRERHPAPDDPEVTRPWDSISLRLAAQTDGQVKVNGETLRLWNIRWVQEQFVERLAAEVGGAA